MDVDVIKVLFQLAISYKDIVEVLKIRLGIELSERHLKRLLKAHGLRRRAYDEDVNATAVIDFISSQLQGSGRMHGYRWMHIKCIQAGHHVRRDVVQMICRALDPTGVELRRRHRLTRRQYFAAGPDFIWHLDGYDKLKPYGVCISGCIDGFSRRIVWLEASSSNNDPQLIGMYYLNAVAERSGCPTIVRGDFGTENVVVRDMQTFLRRNSTDSRSGVSSYMSGECYTMHGFIYRTLKYRRLRGDMIEVYKIIHNIYDSRASPYLPLNSRANTRGNDYKVLNFSFHYDLRKHFLLHVLLIFGIACLIQLLMLAL